jgi:hypothetical protein
LEARRCAVDKPEARLGLRTDTACVSVLLAPALGYRTTDSMEPAAWHGFPSSLTAGDGSSPSWPGLCDKLSVRAGTSSRTSQQCAQQRPGLMEEARGRSVAAGTREPGAACRASGRSLMITDNEQMGGRWKEMRGCRLEALQIHEPHPSSGSWPLLLLGHRDCGLLVVFPPLRLSCSRLRLH